ncbi:MAG TPA: FAD-dependent oxidoreductase [Isosphaeraceae bacterium]|jgi:pyruvate/2-oxoglutarate dehydrogenase complex dihydrolipoamide dehydrogenase (E3) component|nr:FAD-dependent oxidoreductase [Isosphaeraceae bacterium]
MYDLVVLGGGAGGLNVATAAARVGAKVALVEQSRLGGECTFTACVPSKALIQAAKLAHQARTAGAFGIRTGDVNVDFAAVMARVRSVVADFGGGDSAEILRSKGIDVYFGSPAFEAYDTVLVDGQNRLEGRRFVIATGSRAAIPAIPGLAEAGYLDNVSVWNLTERPESLLVIGAGPVGIEFGQAFARLGSQVTILTDAPHILPREDPEVSDRVQALLEAEGIRFHTNVAVTGVTVDAGKKVCKFRNKADGATFEAARSQILVATGRLANVEGLNLEVVGVHADPEHGIEVDDYLQTHSRHVLAIGDVLGRWEFTHAAEREAAVAFQNAVLRIPKKMDYSTIPWATFSDPEVASIGRLSPPAQSDAIPETRTFRVELANVDRPRIDGQTSGFAKLLATPGGKILGVTIVGPEASCVLQEFVLAMEHNLTLSDIMGTVHTYPTYAGVARKLANQFGASRLEKGYVRTALRWFFGFEPKNADGAQPAPPTNVNAEPVGHDHVH